MENDVIEYKNAVPQNVEHIDLDKPAPVEKPKKKTTAKKTTTKKTTAKKTTAKKTTAKKAHPAPKPKVEEVKEEIVVEEVVIENKKEEKEPGKVALYSSGKISHRDLGRLVIGYNIVNEQDAQEWVMVSDKVRVATPEEVAIAHGV